MFPAGCLLFLHSRRCSFYSGYLLPGLEITCLRRPVALLSRSTCAPRPLAAAVGVNPSVVGVRAAVCIATTVKATGQSVFRIWENET